MAAIEYYPALKQAHFGLAATSIALFGVRGIGVLAGAAWPMAALLRRGSAAIDTLLLTAGGTLWWMLSLQPVRDAWLGTKLLLVLLYIALGMLALKRAPSRAGKGLAFAAALATAACIVAIALAHDAHAPLRWFGG